MRPCRTIVAEIVIRSDCSVGEEFAEARERHRRAKLSAASKWYKARRASAFRANLRWRRTPEAMAWKREYMREYRKRYKRPSRAGKLAA
jgi:hypothetical protein